MLQTFQWNKRKISTCILNQLDIQIQIYGKPVFAWELHEECQLIIIKPCLPTNNVIPLPGRCVTAGGNTKCTMASIKVNTTLADGIISTINIACNDQFESKAACRHSFPVAHVRAMKSSVWCSCCPFNQARLSHPTEAMTFALQEEEQ